MSKVAPAASAVASLLETIKAQAESFDVAIGGCVFTFRYLKDGNEWSQLKESAAEWARVVGSKKCPVELKPYKVYSKESLVWCSLLAGLSIDSKDQLAIPDDAPADAVPEWKSFGHVPASDWLKLARDAPLAFETVVMRANDEITGNVRIQRQEAILAGKDD